MRVRPPKTESEDQCEASCCTSVKNKTRISLFYSCDKCIIIVFITVVSIVIIITKICSLIYDYLRYFLSSLCLYKCIESESAHTVVSIVIIIIKTCFMIVYAIFYVIIIMFMESESVHHIYTSGCT